MNVSKASSTRLHWNYFLALEKDMEAVSRYIEFCPDNLNTYSIELAHLLFSAASEIDTLAKCVCNLLNPNAKAENINDYQRIIKAGEDIESKSYPFHNRPAREVDRLLHRTSSLRIFVTRYNLSFVPWESWSSNKNPDWWNSCNKVKHERNQHFNKATLGNALQALAGLLVMNYVYHRLVITKNKPNVKWQYREKLVTRRMEPQSLFLRFEEDFYDVSIASPWARFYEQIEE